MKFKNTRGYRNNNPGNLRPGAQWAGLSKVQSDNGFAQFTSMYMGHRAQLKLLNNYIKNGYNTISKIILRYAPTCENDSASYIRYVSDITSIAQDLVVSSAVDYDSISTLAKISSAIITYENGDKSNYCYWYHAGIYTYYNCFL